MPDNPNDNAVLSETPPDIPSAPTSRHATKEEKEERVQWMMDNVLANGPRRAIADFPARFGLSEATAQVYLKWARERLLKAVNTDKESHILQCYTELQDIITREGTPSSVRVRAIQAKMSLLGCRAPIVLDNRVQIPEYDPRAQRKLLENPRLQEAALKLDSLIEDVRSCEESN